MRHLTVLRHALLLLSLSAVCASSPAAPLSFVPGHIYASSGEFEHRSLVQYNAQGDTLAVLNLPSLSADEETKGIAFGLDRRLYVVVDDLFDSARLVALDGNGKELSSYPLPGSVGGNLSFGKLVFPDANTALIGSGAGLYKVNLKTGVTQQFGNIGEVFDLEVMPNGHLLIAQGYRVTEVDGASGAQIRTLSLSDPNHVSAATFFSMNDLRGIEFDPAANRLYVTMLGNSDNLFFKTMIFDFASGVLTHIGTFNYGDDMYLGADGTLVLGSRTQSPWLLSKSNLGLIRQTDAGPRMFVTRYEPSGSLPAVAYFDMGPVVLSGTPVTLDVLANDVGFGENVNVSVATPPANGVATVTGSPGHPSAIRIDYVANAGYVGSYSFVYQVSDGVHTDTATVTVRNSASKAFDDSYTVVKGESLELPVASNDVGFGGQVSLLVVTLPDHNGTTYISSNNPSPTEAARIHYNPYCCSGEEDYTETFTYQISNGVTTDSARVRVHVISFIARDDTAHTNVGTAVSIPVGANDFGFGPDAQLQMLNIPAHGTVSLTGSPGASADFAAIYTPNPGFSGVDTFQYAVDDGVHVGTATVTVTVMHDLDGDAITDETDNCTLVGNPDQRDSNGDGFGNLCDGDLNNDRMVNFADLTLMKQRFASRNADADLNGDGVVNFADLAHFRTLFGKPPGPSALVH